MKIAMIGLRGIPGVSGGVENVVENLAPRLAKLGHDVTVYCRNPYCKDKVKTFKDVNLRYLPCINVKVGETLSHSMLASMDVLFKKYDIVHYHAMGNGLFTIIPKKTVLTLHGLDWEREKWGPTAKLFLKFSGMCVNHFPNKVISVSNKIKEHYKKQYNKDIIFIPNGVDIVATRPIYNLKRFGLKKNGYILFLSRIVPEKEVHTLIQAFKNVKTNKKLVIVGDATHTFEYQEKIREMAKTDKRIILAGPLYNVDKIEAFSNCEFFVLPSTIEGMPIVLLEAMSFGKCPLVSNIEENLDVIRDNGYAFRVRDVNDLTKQLEYMLKHKTEVRKKGLKCKEYVKANYDWDTIAKQTLEVYKDARKS
ncbi:MAG: glycosyltransferase family 4 protein [Candidatus Woesearchaeota archaeon]